MFTFKKNPIVSAIMIVLLLALLAGCGNSATAPESAGTPPAETQKPAEESAAKEEPKPAEVSSIRIGTSSSGSPFYIIAVGMGQMIQELAGINTTVEPVGGSDPNIFSIGANKVDMAMVTALSASKGYYGEEPFKEKVDVNLVAQGQKSMRQILVTKKSGIKTPEDLEGKTIVAKRPALPEIEMITNALLDVYGIPKDSVNMVSTAETKEAIEALSLGRVDAAVLPASLGAADLMQLFEEDKVEFLQIDLDKRDEMMELLPKSLTAAPIPAGTYKGQDAEINAFAFSTYLVSSAALPEETVYQVTKALLGNPEKMAAIHREGKEWTVENSLANPSLPFHPGAIKYYKEIGKWDASMDGIQAELEKR